MNVSISNRLHPPWAARNPKIGLPDGWGERQKLLPAAEAAAVDAASAVGDAEMFDPRDLDFDLDDLLLDGENAVRSGRDSGRSSTSSSTLNDGKIGGSAQVYCVLSSLE